MCGAYFGLIRVHSAPVSLYNRSPDGTTSRRCLVMGSCVRISKPILCCPMAGIHIFYGSAAVRNGRLMQ